MKNNNIIFAPNIHAGGGAVLLNDLIRSAKSYEIKYYLDCRFKKIICIDADDKNITWVRAGVWGRLLSEVDLWSMESKLVPGLQFAGEILDVDGICGGYNLQWAWSSGILAGRNAGRGPI